MKLNKRSLAVVVSVVGWLVTRQATVAYATDHPGPTCEGTFAAADNPHRLTGNCTVPASGLTIEPGVTLNGQNFSLSVQGTLTANGTAQQPITFTNVVLSFNTGSGGSVTNNTFSGPSGSVVISILAD